MKKYILVLLVVLLSGCGVFERSAASITGGGYSTCYEGVTYVQFTSGASVAYNILVFLSVYKSPFKLIDSSFSLLSISIILFSNCKSTNIIRKQMFF